MEIQFTRAPLTPAEQAAISAGFDSHSESANAPAYAKESVKWIAANTAGQIVAGLSATILWDWLYIDELWVAADERGRGLGRQLVEQSEQFAASENLVGLWLWTQSWQAELFYRRLGFQEFTRFENFPRGHCRIGFRKHCDE